MPIVMVTAFPDPLTPLLGPAKIVAWPLHVTLTLPSLAFVLNIEHLQLCAHPLWSTRLSRIIHSGSLDTVVSAFGRLIKRYAISTTFSCG